jgi:sugar phosphate isomerase/epimerase
MKRRTFLKASAAATAALGMVPSWAGRLTGGWRPGLALYTVIDRLRVDFEGTLKAVADIGYRDVETIGAMGRDPDNLRELLADHGLKATSQHMAPAGLYAVFDQIVKGEITLEQLTREYLQHFNPTETERIIEEGIDRAQKLGQTYLVWPILFKQQLASREKILEMCKAFDLAGRMCADAGLVFNFHNHADEFAPVDGQIPYDIILENTDPAVVKMQMDVFWVTSAGVDPYRYLDRYVDRFRQAHLKDITASREGTDVGTGLVNFERFISTAMAGGVKQFYVEQDKPAKPLVSIRRAYDHLTTL